MPVFSRIFLIFVVTALLVACSSPTPTPTPEPTPTPVPPTSTPIPAADGQVIFQSRCASCHFLTDQDQVGPGLAGLFSGDLMGQPFTEQGLIDLITNGGSRMPGIQLSGEQMDALIEYLREATQ